MLLGDSDGLIKGARRGLPTVAEHRDLETYLARYSGLILYLKEMDESTYGKLCGVRQLHILLSFCSLIYWRTELFLRRK